MPLSLSPDSVEATWGSDPTDRSLADGSWSSQDGLILEPTKLEQQPLSLELQHFHLCDTHMPYFHTGSGIGVPYQDLSLSRPIFHGRDTHFHNPNTNDVQVFYFTPTPMTDGYAANAYTGTAEDSRQTSRVLISDIDANNKNSSSSSSRKQKKNAKHEEKSNYLSVALETYIRDPQAHEEFAYRYTTFDSYPRGAAYGERHAR
ncbi:hypothetical protein F5X99DRAFT_412329 [Biscogniauxia marginata]|nr:hypothetical protein F5X99DRAFT_412329 [Biscogniauxia marginata]